MWVMRESSKIGTPQTWVQIVVVEVPSMRQRVSKVHKSYPATMFYLPPQMLSFPKRCMHNDATVSCGEKGSRRRLRLYHRLQHTIRHHRSRFIRHTNAMVLWSVAKTFVVPLEHNKIARKVIADRNLAEERAKYEALKAKFG
jgi:hypothetical protein